MLPFQCRGQGTHHTLPSQQSRQLAQNKRAPPLKQAAADRAAKPAERRGSTHHARGGCWPSVDATSPDAGADGVQDLSNRGTSTLLLLSKRAPPVAQQVLPPAQHE